MSLSFSRLKQKFWPHFLCLLALLPPISLASLLSWVHTGSSPASVPVDLPSLLSGALSPDLCLARSWPSLASPSQITAPLTTQHPLPPSCFIVSLVYNHVTYFIFCLFFLLSSPLPETTRTVILVCHVHGCPSST